MSVENSCENTFPSELSISQMLERHATRRAAAPAVLSGDRKPLSFSRLNSLFRATCGQLRSWGIGPEDRVGIVLPNGAEMATCFLCVAGAATAAPLNPGYRQTEFEFYLADLHAKALIVANDSPSAARDAARELGITVFCAGGMIAHEMAQQLIEDSQRVALLALVDTAHPTLYERTPRWVEALRTVKLRARRTLLGALLACRHPGSIRLGERIVNETIRRGAEQYRPRPHPCSLTLIRSEQHHRSDAPDLGWTGKVMQNVEIRLVPGEHVNMFSPANIGPAARALNDCVRKAQARQPRSRIKLAAAHAAQGMHNVPSGCEEAKGTLYFLEPSRTSPFVFRSLVLRSPSSAVR